MIETTLVGKQGLSRFPSVLGESHPGQVAQPPEVRFSEVDDGVRFTPTSCGSPSMSSASIGAGTQPLGTGTVTVEGEAIMLPRDLPYFGKSNTVQLGTGVTTGYYAISLHIPEASAKQIQEREHEHVDDFTVAFELSFQALASAINSLASQTFSGDTPQEAQHNALSELARTVPYLVPAQPEDLSAWAQQAKRVYAALAGLSSTGRDGQDPSSGSQAEDYPHKVVWYADAEPAAGNEKVPKLLITPHMGPAGIPAAALITVEAAQDDKSLGSWTHSASQRSDRGREVPFVVNTRVRITRNYVFDGKTLPADCQGIYYGKNDSTDNPLEFYFELPYGYKSEDFSAGYTNDVFPWDILDFVEIVASGSTKGEKDSPTGTVDLANDLANDLADFDALLRDIVSATKEK